LDKVVVVAQILPSHDTTATGEEWNAWLASDHPLLQVLGAQVYAPVIQQLLGAAPNMDVAQLNMVRNITKI
jgi:hypothetical protein